MKKAVILIFAMFLIILPSVLASTIKQFDFVNSNANGTDTHLSQGAPGSNYATSSPLYAGSGGGGAGDQYRSLYNLSFLADGSIPTGATINNFIMECKISNLPVALSNLRFYPLCSGWKETIVTWTNYNNGGVNMTDFNGTKDLLTSYNGLCTDANRCNFSIDTPYAQKLFDNNLNSCGAGIMRMSAINTADSVIGFVSSDSATPADRCVFYINYTNTLDTTPPNIESYNLTSEGGCTNWDNDKNNACTTSDTTPTISVETDDYATCAIGIEDKNYTGLGAGRQCNGVETELHTCTLIPQDELTQETSYIYIGCKNQFGIENRSSTSGALKVSIHTSNLENSGRIAIEAGISTALSSGYTIYTNQKVYARNSANVQSAGTFDKVVKWMSKIWVFNLLTGNDTMVNMSNITPVLYVLEMINVTNTTINASVYNLIMSTK